VGRTGTSDERDKLLNNKLPAVIIVGGDHNALSIARSLGSAGVDVYSIGDPQALVKYSRFSKWVALPRGRAIAPEVWAAYLLGPGSEHLRGAVLLAASDEAIELIARHRDQLSEKFRLDLSNPVAQLCMLDKLGTYRAAQAAGVPTPKFWIADTREQVAELQRELVYPLIVKPLLGHEFKRKFSGTFAVVHNFDELLNAFDKVHRAGIKAFLVEMIPGPDDRLCSYYTYLDEVGNNLVDFTKRVIRRYPVNMGGSTYHITDDVAGVKQLGLALFRQVGLQGIANVEFKLDERDGQLKLIECNARFTAADCLLVASGLNLPLFVYNRIIGRTEPAPTTFRMGLRLWKPLGDFLAYRQLSKMGLLNCRAWLRSILHPQSFPIFRWNDPLPSLVNGARLLRIPLSHLQFRTTPAKKAAEPKALTLARPDLQTGIEPAIQKTQR
jgi:predicted ATP-grasp superfamily ATP-dependent carboligase